MACTLQDPAGDGTADAGPGSSAASTDTTAASTVHSTSRTHDTADATAGPADGTTGGATVIPTCGDGIVEAWEECDDGNRASWDGCQWNCRRPPPVQISADRYGTCVVDGPGVKCWGRNVEGRLGLGQAEVGACAGGCERDPICCAGDDETPSTRPASFSGDHVLAVATGSASCALTDAQTLLCWGDGSSGQLGPDVYAACEAPLTHTMPGHDPSCDTAGCCIGDDEPASEGVEIDLGGVEQVVQLESTTCALLVGGDVNCWGRSPAALGLGTGWEPYIGDDEPIDVAPRVEVGGKAVYLATGALQTCALLEDGSVRCWGVCGLWDPRGYQHHCLGQPAETGEVIGDDESPADVPPLALAGPAAQVDIGNGGGCAVLVDGRVHCWGAAALTGHASSREDPLSPAETEPIAFALPALEVEVGLSNCALLLDGTVVCWGRGYATLGTGEHEDQLDAAVAPSASLGGPAIALAGGAEHRCVVRDDLAILCWGLSGAGFWPGRLGYGNLEHVGDDETPASVGPVSVW